MAQTVGTTTAGGMSDAGSDACVIVPMFNEAQVIEGVVRGLKTAFPHVVCVDDGSADSSAESAERAGALVVRHCSNFGQGAALRTGLELALSLPDLSYFITFDADGQHQVSDALRLLRLAKSQDVDMVLGSRFLAAGTSQIPRSRRAILRGAVHFSKLTTGLSITDAHNGLRVLNRRAAVLMDIRLHGMAHASEILHIASRYGLTYCEAPVSVLYTDYSRSKGQPGINALNIAFDLLIDRARVAR